MPSYCNIKPLIWNLSLSLCSDICQLFIHWADRLIQSPFFSFYNNIWLFIVHLWIIESYCHKIPTTKCFDLELLHKWWVMRSSIFYPNTQKQTYFCLFSMKTFKLMGWTWVYMSMTFLNIIVDKYHKHTDMVVLTGLPILWYTTPSFSACSHCSYICQILIL